MVLIMVHFEVESFLKEITVGIIHERDDKLDENDFLILTELLIWHLVEQSTSSTTLFLGSNGKGSLKNCCCLSI